MIYAYVYIYSYIHLSYIYQCYIVSTWYEAVSSERLQAATEYRRDVTVRKVAAALGDSVAAKGGVTRGDIGPGTGKSE